LINILRSIPDNVGHFGGVLLSQYLGLVLKKTNLTE